MAKKAKKTAKKVAKIRVEFPENLPREDRKAIRRLCRRLGKIENTTSSLILKIRNLPVRKVSLFLESQPKIISARKI